MEAIRVSSHVLLWYAASNHQCFEIDSLSLSRCHKILGTRENGDPWSPFSQVKWGPPHVLGVTRMY